MTHDLIATLTLFGVVLIIILIFMGYVVRRP
jgi:hypothetical protein